MIRVCRTKRDVKDADKRQSRNRRKRQRGRTVEDVRLVLVCNPCGGRPIEEHTLPNGEELRGVVFEEISDILCLQHALKFKQRTERDLSMGDFMERLRQSNWDAAPWNPSEPEEDRVPHLYTYVCAVTVPVLSSSA